MPPKDKYSDPKLRDQIKEELHNSDKGGAPGQWSARKAQMMAAEYKKRGGSYTTDKEHGQDEQQKHLDKWTEEEWQTKEGSGHAKKDDGTQKRYLPKKAWEKMDKQEKEETDEKKQQQSKKGKQHVANTAKAKEARREVDEEEEAEAEEDKTEKQTKAGKSSGRQTRSNTRKRDAPESETAQSDSNKKPKSERPSKSNAKQSKATTGSKHDSAIEPAPQGSVKRLPKVGQRVSWKALPGWVHGKVTEIVTSNKSVYGKSVKAEKNDPRIALEADSGKGCVHKVESCYYD